MALSSTNLAELRRRIDEIDGALHDLLMRRAEMAGEVLRAKGGAPVWRPAREAQVLRRLAARHAGPFPLRALVQIWREIVSATARLQGDLAVAAHTPGGDRACADLARDHFGRAAPVETFELARDVLDAVDGGAAAVGVLGVPPDGRVAPWWNAVAGDDGLAICAELPFARPPGAGGRAFCVARVPLEGSGDDRSLVAVDVRADAEVDDPAAVMAAAGAGGWRARGSCVVDGRNRHFLECGGFLDPGDAGLARLIEAPPGPVDAVTHLGSWPAPLALEGSAAGGEGR